MSTPDFMGNPTFSRSKVYEHLLEILTQRNFLIQPQILSVLKTRLNDPVTPVDIVPSFTYVSTKTEILPQVIEWAVKNELQTTSRAELFRENSLCSSFVQNGFKLVGAQYLENTLAPVIKELVNTNVDLEINPSIVKSEKEREKNLENLVSWSQKAVNAIFDSMVSFPPLLRSICRHLYQETLNTFDEEENEISGKNAVIAFLFLRYINVALVSPHLHGIVKEPVRDKVKSRNLVLIAKMVQTLANGSHFAGGYMEGANEFLAINMNKMDNYIRKLVEKAGDMRASVTLTAAKPSIDTEMMQQLGVIIQFFNQIDTEQIMRQTQVSLVPGVKEGTGAVTGEEIGEIFSCYAKMKWISTTKDWFISNEQHPALTLPAGSHKMQKIISRIEKGLTRSISKNPSQEKLSVSLSSHATLSDWYDAQLKKFRFIIVVAFRGSWCLWCKKHMQDWNRFSGILEDNGCALYGLCSDAQDICDKTKEKWGLNYDLLGDPNNTLSDFFNVAVDNSPFWKAFGEYKNGMNQPGILCVSQDREILYYWRSIPTLQNLYGARARPDPKDVVRTLLDKVEIMSTPSDEMSRSTSFEECDVCVDDGVSVHTSSSPKQPTDVMGAISRMSPSELQQALARLAEDEKVSVLMYDIVKGKKKEIKQLKKKHSKELKSTGSRRKLVGTK